MDLRSARKQRMQDSPSRLPGNVCQHLPGFSGISARRSDGRHRLADFASTDGLQGTRDLRDVFNAADSHPHFAG